MLTLYYALLFSTLGSVFCSYSLAQFHCWCHIQPTKLAQERAKLRTNAQTVLKISQVKRYGRQRSTNACTHDMNNFYNEILTQRSRAEQSVALSEVCYSFG